MHALDDSDGDAKRPVEYAQHGRVQNQLVFDVPLTQGSNDLLNKPMWPTQDQVAERSVILEVA